VCAVSAVVLNHDHEPPPEWEFLTTAHDFVASDWDHLELTADEHPTLVAFLADEETSLVIFERDAFGQGFLHGVVSAFTEVRPYLNLFDV
jgi:hypothetical protein